MCDSTGVMLSHMLVSCNFKTVHDPLYIQSAIPLRLMDPKTNADYPKTVHEPSLIKSLFLAIRCTLRRPTYLGTVTQIQFHILRKELLQFCATYMYMYNVLNDNTIKQLFRMQLWKKMSNLVKFN